LRLGEVFRHAFHHLADFRRQRGELGACGVDLRLQLRGELVRLHLRVRGGLLRGLGIQFLSCLLLGLFTGKVLVLLSSIARGIAGLLCGLTQVVRGLRDRSSASLRQCGRD
jgi:hypothetical protein